MNFKTLLLLILILPACKQEKGLFKPTLQKEASVKVENTDKYFVEPKKEKSADEFSDLKPKKDESCTVDKKVKPGGFKLQGGANHGCEVK